MASTYVLRPRLSNKGCSLISEVGDVGRVIGDDGVVDEDEEDNLDKFKLLQRRIRQDFAENKTDCISGGLSYNIQTEELRR